MEIKELLQEITQISGATGFEEPVAQKLISSFEPYCDQVYHDEMMNVFATVGVGMPHIGIFAHSDEIALIVSAIEDGFLRLARLGGVDPRILPGHTVRVLGRDAEYPGVVGFKPPHLTTAQEAAKAVKLNDLYVDIGFGPDEVEKHVRVGDVVLLTGEAQELAGGRMASKTMDDRCLVAVMVKVAELLRERRNHPKVTFIASSQEEVGLRGSKVAAFKQMPDIAIVLDVTFADQPGTDSIDTFSMDKIVYSVGPILHPGLVKRAKEVLKRMRLPYGVDVTSSGSTGTDASAVHITREGIPCLLLAVPVKYMHTTVELLDTKTLDEMAAFLVEFLLSLSDWEDIVCY